MEINVLGYIFFGLLMGLSEFLPVSASGNGYLYTLILGMQDHTPLLSLAVHLGCLGALLTGCGKRLLYIYRQLKMAALPTVRRKRQPDTIAVLDGKLLLGAVGPMALCMVICKWLQPRFENLPMVVLLLVISGILVYIPQHHFSGNRQSRTMSRMDSIALGISAGLGILPGMSRLGVTVSVGLLRGGDREYMLNIGLQLSVLSLFVMVVMDLIALLMAGFAGITLAVVLVCLAAAALAFAAGCGAILLVRYLAVKAGFSGFAYLSFGTAMLGFILYLIT